MKKKHRKKIRTLPTSILVFMSRIYGDKNHTGVCFRSLFKKIMNNINTYYILLLLFITANLFLNKANDAWFETLMVDIHWNYVMQCMHRHRNLDKSQSIYLIYENNALEIHLLQTTQFDASHTTPI